MIEARKKKRERKISVIIQLGLSALKICGRVPNVVFYLQLTNQTLDCFSRRVSDTLLNENTHRTTVEQERGRLSWKSGVIASNQPRLFNEPHVFTDGSTDGLVSPVMTHFA